MKSVSWLLVIFCVLIASPFSDSLNVDLVGQYIGGKPRDVFVAGNYAYVAGIEVFSIIDITDKAKPVMAGYHDMEDKTFGLAWSVYVSGDYAYITDWYNGLRIFDISDPASPTEIGAFEDLSFPMDVHVSGNYAYIADDSSGLKILDVSNPASPTEVSAYDLNSTTRSVHVSGNYAYVAHGSFSIIDISNPDSPTRTGYVYAEGAREINVKDTYAYIASDYGGLKTFDISDPASPTEVSFCSTPGTPFGIYVSGDFVYIAAESAGLRIINISDPDTPTETGYFDTLYAQRVYVSDDYAYVADEEAGLRIIDISVPETPTETGMYNPPNEDRSICVSGDYVYVADCGSGLVILDVSQSDIPAQVGFYETPSARGVDVSGNYAYVTDYDSGLRVIDISDPSTPFEVGAMGGLDRAKQVYVSGNYAYVTDFYDTLRIINISSPNTPFQAGFFDVLDSAEDVYVVGNYAYIADYSDGLRIIDISTPATPFEVGSHNTQGYAESVSVSGNYAYVAYGWSGLRIFDISTPATPDEIGSINTPGSAKGVDIEGNYAYVADENYGVRVIDISYPEMPTEVGYFETHGEALTVDVSGNYIYAGDRYYGLHVLEYPYLLIRGTISESNTAPILGVTVSLFKNGNTISSSVTDDTGNFVFHNLEKNATYSITPSYVHCSGFLPSERSYTDLSSDIVDSDFTGTLNRWSISGEITEGADPLSGVTVNLTGDTILTTVTNDSGVFTFDDLIAGSTYILTPDKTHYTFTPNSGIIIDLASDITSANFSASIDRWTVSGSITDGNSLLGGVTLELTGNSTVSTITNKYGNYAFSNLPAGVTYNIQPLIDYYYTEFFPSERTYPDLSINIATGDFLGTLNFADDLESVNIYPNPWNDDIDSVTFDSLTENTVIRIYSISGELIAELNPDMISYEWDITNDNGNKIAAGMYFCLITNDKGEKAIKKLAVIR